MGRHTTLVVERRRRCTDPGLTLPAPALSRAGQEQGEPPDRTVLRSRSLCSDRFARAVQKAFQDLDNRAKGSRRVDDTLLPEEGACGTAQRLTKANGLSMTMC